MSHVVLRIIGLSTEFLHYRRETGEFVWVAQQDGRHVFANAEEANAIVDRLGSGIAVPTETQPVAIKPHSSTEPRATEPPAIPAAIDWMTKWERDHE